MDEPMPDWLDTPEKETAAAALPNQLWQERTPHYRDLLESVIFQYVHDRKGQT